MTDLLTRNPFFIAVTILMLLQAAWDLYHGRIEGWKYLGWAFANVAILAEGVKR